MRNILALAAVEHAVTGRENVMLDIIESVYVMLVLAVPESDSHI